MYNGIKKLFFVLGVGLLLFLPANFVRAAGVSEVKIFDAVNFIPEKRFFISFSKMDEAPSLAIVDLGGDGVSEIVVGAPYGKKPEVKIYREDGSLVNSFMVYDENFLGGVNVGAGDLDGDGQGEIAVAPGADAAAEIKIFDGYGKPEVSEGFFAFDKNLKNGASVAVCDLDGDGRGEIIVGSGPWQETEIRLFKSTGEILDSFKPAGINKWSGARTAAGDLDGDGTKEIIVAPGWGSTPEVQIFTLDGTFVRKFLVYAKNFRGGVNLTVGDQDGDGRDEIIVGAGFTGGPHARIFDGDGKLENQFFPFDKNSRSGVLVGVGKFDGGETKIVAMPQKTEPSGRRDLYKYIEIDISEQKLKFYENGFLLGTNIVSTGTWKMPTPLGTFKIMSKSEVAYSNAYSLYMPHFMLFTKGGAGIHGLPYWKSSKGIVYEGVNHLGKRVSHGCVRLALDAAEAVFEWADKGVAVVVHQ
jgi:hypothetical protein